MTSGKQDDEFIGAIINPRLLEEAISWIASNMEPEDVFPQSELESWAEQYGYSMEED